jgi:phospho-N-acetylmuramoyl-pentapeptide-transferase
VSAYCRRDSRHDDGVTKQMLYYLLYQLVFQLYGKGSESYFFKGLNVFQYVTFRTAWATITALLVSLLFGGKMIRKLAALKFGQEVREEGVPLSHQEKRGTPTMGGVLILVSVFLSTILWARLDSLYLWLALGATTAFGIIGFLDDYIKIVKKRSLGLTGKQKLFGQLITALIVWGCLYWLANYPWNISIPFFKATAEVNGVTYVGAFVYLFFIIFILLGSSNAVNLTDGLDGLASSVTFIAMSALTALTYVSSDRRWAEYIDITHKPEAAELTVFCGAMVGASLGFLWYNSPPAQVFMGDVGSLAIGGALGTVAILTKQEFLLPFIGGVFILEAASVMLQVAVFKMTKRGGKPGKRIFKMTPLHHHFEMSGWKEPKIVFRFVIVAILFALLSLSTLKLR